MDSTSFEICKLKCQNLHGYLKARINAGINLRVNEKDVLVIYFKNGDDIFKMEYENFFDNYVVNEWAYSTKEFAEDIVKAYKKHVMQRYFFI